MRAEVQRKRQPSTLFLCPWCPLDLTLAPFQQLWPEVFWPHPFIHMILGKSTSELSILATQFARQYFNYVWTFCHRENDFIKLELTLSFHSLIPLSPPAVSSASVTSEATRSLLSGFTPTVAFSHPDLAALICVQQKNQYEKFLREQQSVVERRDSSTSTKSEDNKGRKPRIKLKALLTVVN